MAIHENIKPDDQSIPYLMAGKALSRVDALANRPSGAISFDNSDGSRTVIGGGSDSTDIQNNGSTVSEQTGKTSAPGTPSGLKVASNGLAVTLTWDGSFGNVPGGYRRVRATVTDEGGSTFDMGSLTAAGSLTTVVDSAGMATVNVWSEDDATADDGTPSVNRSPTVSLEVVCSELVDGEQLDKDLDAAKTRLDTAEQGIESNQSAAQSAADDAAKALSEASSASTAASGAQSTANDAKSAADSAASAANKAQSSADNAASAASKAQSTADSAAQAAASAGSKADTAASDAAAASKAASDANTAAGNAQSAADSASKAASDASSKADSAATDAAAASKTASDAATLAGNANTAASKAQDAANSASSKADSASSAASKAQQSADSAQSAANNAQSTANTAVQNAADALKSANSALAHAKNITFAVDAPTQPLKGDVWYPMDSSKHVIGMKTWSGSAWTDVTIMAGTILVPGSIGTTLIQDGAITTGKVKAGSLTADTVLVPGSLTASNIIAPNTIEAAQLKANSVTSDKIAANAVNATHIAAGSIDASKIKGNKLVGTEIQTSDNDPHMLLTQTSEYGINRGILQFVSNGSDNGGLSFYKNTDSSGNDVENVQISLEDGTRASNTNMVELGADSSDGPSVGYQFHVVSGSILLDISHGNARGNIAGLQLDDEGLYYYRNTDTASGGGYIAGHSTLYDRGSAALSGSHHIYATDSFTKAKFLDVYYSSVNGTQGYTRVWNPQNGTKFVTQIVQEGGDGNLWAMTNTYLILNDSEMNVVSDRKGGWLGGQNPLGIGKSQTDANPIFITHVEGWFD